MKILDKYLLRELFKLFGAVLIVISVAFVIQRLIFLTEWSMHRGIGMLGVLKLLLCLFPGLYLTAVPLVGLFSIILVLSQMSEENELVVMMGCGRDLGALSRPVLLFSLIGTIVTAYLSFFLTPASVRKFEILKWELIQAKSEKAIPTQRFIEFSEDSLIYVQEKNPHGLEKVIIYKGKYGEGIMGKSGGKESGIIFAKRARILEEGENNKSLLYLKNGVFISHQSEPEVDQFIQFEKGYAKINFADIEELRKKLRTQLTTLSFPDLIDSYLYPDQKLTGAKQGQKDKKKKYELSFDKQLRIELTQRMSQVLSALLLSLWGIGLGVKPPRTSRTISYVLGVLAGFGYYYLNVLFKALALKKILPIEIALWSPALLVLLSGAVLVRLRMKGREPLNFLYQADEYFRQWRIEKTQAKEEKRKKIASESSGKLTKKREK